MSSNSPMAKFTQQRISRDSVMWLSIGVGVGLALGLLGVRGGAGAAARATVWRVLICSTSVRSA